MAFELPTLPFPKDALGTPYIASPDASGKYTAASGQWFANASNLWVPVSAANPLPTTMDDGKSVSMGAKADAALIDPTASASVIAALKGLIKQLQGTGTGAVPTTLTGRKVALATGDYSQALNVPIGGSSTITIQPSAGELWRLKVLRLIVPASSTVGATSGTYTVQICEGSGDGAYRVMSINSNYNLEASIAENIIATGTTKTPSTESAQQNAILNIIVTNASALRLYFINNTNVIMTQAITLKIGREVEYIVS